MMRKAYLIACVTLTMAASMAPAQAQSAPGEWVSYRDAYRAMVVFEKYGGPKHLLQNHLQVLPRTAGMLDEGVQLTLQGKSTQLNLPLDELGRTVLPLLKAAYDDNAVLVPNRPLGGFSVRARVSLAVRADGSYDAADLRAGCIQALEFTRHVDARWRQAQCVGVRFVYAANVRVTQVQVRLQGQARLLPLAPGEAFGGDAAAGLMVVTYRFMGAGGEQVLTSHAPLAIVPLYE